MLRELARSYLTIVKDLSRVMNRLKALYRSWAIPCAGRDVYYTRHRSQWLEKIPEAGTRRRAEQLYQVMSLLYCPTSVPQIPLNAGAKSCPRNQTFFGLLLYSPSPITWKFYDTAQMRRYPISTKLNNFAE